MILAKDLYSPSTENIGTCPSRSAERLLGCTKQGTLHEYPNISQLQFFLPELQNIFALLLVCVDTTLAHLR